MKKNKDELPLFKKILIVIIMSIMCFINSSVFAYTLPNFDEKNDVIIDIQLTQTTALEELIEDYIKSLEKQSCLVYAVEINKESLLRDLKKYPNEQVNNLIIKNLEVYILSTQLKIDMDNQFYYFKNETDCNNFISKLNTYYEQSYSSKSDVVINMNNLTSEDILENKASELKQKKEKEEEQKRKNYNAISSRNSLSTRVKNSTNVPIASYTYISSYYGVRHGSMHTGVDFAAPAGTYIYAWKSGRVIQACWSGGYGNFIIIQHNDGTVSRYAHCSGFAVVAGQQVTQGQLIGYVGTTGNSTGNHLHFEIKINNNFVNPLDYL